jgi:hypothetical protein
LQARSAWAEGCRISVSSQWSSHPCRMTRRRR